MSNSLIIGVNQMKTCTKCQIPKSLEKFNKQKAGKYGRSSICKSCLKIAQDEVRKTKTGVVKVIYNSQISSSKTRNHKPPAYTVDELRQWFREQPSANQLYKTWVDSGYKKDLRPSVDRKDDDLGYSMDNIQLMTWGENAAKAKRDMKSGKMKHRNKAVVQMDMDGNFIAEYHSARKAGRVTGISYAQISACCNKHREVSNGFRWKFV